MLDNQKITMALIKEMEENLPIPVLPTKLLVKNLREQKQNIKLKSNTKMEIQRIVYLGDEGGIGCECVTIPVRNKEGRRHFIAPTHQETLIPSLLSW